VGITAATQSNVEELDRFASNSIPKNLQQTIRCLSSLKLSKDQQEQIRQIDDAAGQAMQRFDRIAQLGGQQREQIGRRHGELQDEACRQAMQLLSECQRTQWKKLIGKPSDH
jgi:hypothetical protein